MVTPAGSPAGRGAWPDMEGGFSARTYGTSAPDHRPLFGETSARVSRVGPGRGLRGSSGPLRGEPGARPGASGLHGRSRLRPRGRFGLGDEQEVFAAVRPKLVVWGTDPDVLRSDVGELGAGAQPPLSTRSPRQARSSDTRPKRPRTEPERCWEVCSTAGAVHRAQELPVAGSQFGTLPGTLRIQIRLLTLQLVQSECALLTQLRGIIIVESANQRKCEECILMLYNSRSLQIMPHSSLCENGRVIWGIP